MKKTLITLALLSLFGTMAVSCQKQEDFIDLSMSDMNAEVRIVHYVVDSRESTVSIAGRQAWTDFLHYLTTLAEQGHQVGIQGTEAPSRLASSKERVTFSTTNKDEAMAWIDKMHSLGYDVHLSFDKATGTYICTATR